MGDVNQLQPETLKEACAAKGLDLTLRMQVRSALCACAFVCARVCACARVCVRALIVHACARCGGVVDGGEGRKWIGGG